MWTMGKIYVIFLVSWGGVRLSPLGMLAYCTSPGSEIMNVEQLVEWILAGKPEIFGENLLQCHFVHHKSHMTWLGTRAAAVGSRRLTAWAMARPKVYVVRILYMYVLGFLFIFCFIELKLWLNLIYWNSTKVTRRDAVVHSPWHICRNECPMVFVTSPYLDADFRRFA
jgi:hypothetical protein